jgi:hypothetical protein
MTHAPRLSAGEVVMASPADPTQYVCPNCGTAQPLSDRAGDGRCGLCVDDESRAGDGFDFSGWGANDSTPRPKPEGAANVVQVVDEATATTVRPAGGVLC